MPAGLRYAVIAEFVPLARPDNAGLLSDNAAENGAIHAHISKQTRRIELQLLHTAVALFQESGRRLF